MVWNLIQADEEYRDYEPKTIAEMRETGLARVTFNIRNHTAYGTEFNPAATEENFEPTYKDECRELTWDQAKEISGVGVIE